MLFKVVVALWAIAELVIAGAAFGLFGVLLGAAVLAFWAAVFRLPPFTRLGWLVTAVIMFVLAGLLIPAVSAAREWSRHLDCINHMTQVAKALLAYADQTGALPAAAVAARQEIEQSWRVTILPLLDQQRVHDKYRSNEAWNSDHNLAATAEPIGVYACPSDPPVDENLATVNYFAVRDDRAAWPTGRGRALNEFTDGLDQTILLIERAGGDVPWSKPKDLTFDEAVDFLSAPQGDGVVHSDSRVNAQGVNVAFADGSIRFLRLPIPKELATALLTVDGGDQIDEQVLDRLTITIAAFESGLDVKLFYVVSALPLLRCLQVLMAGRSATQRGGQAQ